MGRDMYPVPKFPGHSSPAAYRLPPHCQGDEYPPYPGPGYISGPSGTTNIPPGVPTWRDHCVGIGYFAVTSANVTRFSPLTIHVPPLTVTSLSASEASVALPLVLGITLMDAPPLVTV